jgi:signal transduction histidine kinase
VCEVLGDRAAAKKIDLVGDVEPNVPDRILADGGRLRQVLTNLAGNAVKFTDTGWVSVRVKLDRVEGIGEVVRFEVRDTGIGIAPEVQHRLFESFVQADLSTTKKYGGTGLGLSIVKELVERMGGASA